jgi:hypothetical protein
MTDIDWDNLPPTTAPASFNACVKGFTNQEAGQQLGLEVGRVIQVVGSFMDLSTLDGITIAVDYDQALLELDRGLEGLRPLSRSDSEEMQGVAMLPAVIRDGEVRTHLIFNASMVAALIADEATPEDRASSIAIIAHECAHVQITAEKERSVPDARFGTRIEGYERSVMFQFAEVAWDEYAACRISAPFAPNQNESHAEVVIGSAVEARGRANAAVQQFRRHGDIDRLVAEAGPPLFQPMKAAAYLLGGMDAVEAAWSDYPEVRQALETNEFADLVDSMRSELRNLWDTRDQWDPSLDIFEPLLDIAREVFRSGGLHFRTLEDGTCWVEVP